MFKFVSDPFFLFLFLFIPPSTSIPRTRLEMHHTLQVVEIRINICRYLWTRDLKQCILVLPGLVAHLRTVHLQ